MKNLIFIDNDQERDVQESETFHVYSQLETHFGIDFNNVKIVREFYFKCREEGEDKQFDLLFNKDNVIITYSMYTSSHYGSLFTFNYFLKAAGRKFVKGITYVNVSSEEYMLEALAYNKNDKRFINILRAVSMNNLISYNNDLKSLTKVVVDLSEYSGFKAITITMEEFNEMIGKELKS